MALSGSGRKAKGSRQERRTIVALEAAGYHCTKAGGSLGVWDVIAIGPNDIRLVQVKSNRPPGKAEMERMRAFQSPRCCCTKELWIWIDHQRLPKIIQLPLIPPETRSSIGEI